MDRYLYCSDAATDAQLVRVDKVVGLDVQSATSLFVAHEGLDGIDNAGLLKLTITSGQMLNVQKAIVNAMNYSTDPFIVLADDQTGEYLHSGITGVTAVGVI